MAACARARGAAHHAPANGINRQRPKIITRRCGAGRPITSGGPRRELRPLRRPLRRALAIQVVARIPPGARHAVAAHASCRRGRAYHQRRRAGMHSRPLVGWPCYEPTARAQASAREGGETPTSARPAAARQRAARTASGASGATGHTCCNLLSFTSFRRIKALPHTAAYATQKRLQKTSSGNEAPSVLQVSVETGVPVGVWINVFFLLSTDGGPVPRPRVGLLLLGSCYPLNHRLRP